MVMRSMLRVGIIGASGFTGAELLRLIAQHPEFEVVARHGRHAWPAGAPPTCTRLVERLSRPGLRAVRPRPRPPVSTSSSSACPTTASMALAPQLVGSVGCVVDLSAAYRLKDAAPLPGVLRLRARPAGVARRGGLRPSRTASRRTQRCAADRHARVPRDGGDAGAAPAGRGRRDQAVGHRGRHAHRHHRRRAAPDRHEHASPTSTPTCSPTGCSTIGTRRRWNRRSAPHCSSPRTSCR